MQCDRNTDEGSALADVEHDEGDEYGDAPRRVNLARRQRD